MSFAMICYFSPKNASAVMPAISKIPCTFFPLSLEHRDFPGNVKLGGCDSLPLVLVSTRKQHDSLLGYVVHFLYIISHQNVLRWRARADCTVPQSVADSSPPP